MWLSGDHGRLIKWHPLVNFQFVELTLERGEIIFSKGFYIFYNQFDFLYMNIYNIIKSNVLEMVQFASALYDYILIY